MLNELRHNYWVLQHFLLLKKFKNYVSIIVGLITALLNLVKMHIDNLDRILLKNRTFIDHIGPINVLINNKKCKIWVLSITFTLSRAINLKLT